MSHRLMRCQYCGLLQDEPKGVKTCAHCGGELAYEDKPLPGTDGSYIEAWLELDQVKAPAGRNCDRYLMFTVHTPEEVPPSQAAPTTSGRPALNFCAILDVSGSMSGAKIQQAKEAVRQTLNHLQEGDLFSLVTFSSEVGCVFEPVEINAHTRKTVNSAIQEITAGGMTALCGGLELGLEKVAIRKQDTNLALLLSDGQANVGETDLEKVGLRGYRARQQGIVVSTLGVGRDYNEALMVEIANQGGGRFYHLQNAAEIPTFLMGELGEVANLAARDATLELNLPAGATLIPLVAAYPTRQGDGHASVSIGFLPLDTELEVPLRLTLPAQPTDSKQSIEGSFGYLSPAGNNITAALNRVTVRFVAVETFHEREGVVMPVAERVLQQMRSADVLDISRAFAMNHEEGMRRVASSLDVLRDYAAKLGEERAVRETADFDALIQEMSVSPTAAKMRTSEAFARFRSTKDFRKRKD